MTGINPSTIDATALTAIRVEVVHQRQKWSMCQLCGRDCEKLTEENL